MISSLLGHAVQSGSLWTDPGTLTWNASRSDWVVHQVSPCSHSSSHQNHAIQWSPCNTTGFYLVWWFPIIICPCLCHWACPRKPSVDHTFSVFIVFIWLCSLNKFLLISLECSSHILGLWPCYPTKELPVDCAFCHTLCVQDSITLVPRVQQHLHCYQFLSAWLWPSGLAQTMWTFTTKITIIHPMPPRNDSLSMVDTTTVRVVSGGRTWSLTSI